MEVRQENKGTWHDRLFIEHAEPFAEALRTLPLSSGIRSSLARITSTEAVGGRILDLACGIGRFAPHLAPLATSYVGLDYSEHLIDCARLVNEETGGAISFVTGDMRRVSRVIDGPFDLIVRLYTSLGYFGAAEELEVLQECARVASPGAYLVLDTLNAEYFATHVLGLQLERHLETCILREGYGISRDRGTLECSWTYGYENGREVLVPFELQCFQSEMIGEMLMEGGRSLRQVYANIDGGPQLDALSDHPRLVLVAQRQQGLANQMIAPDEIADRL